MKKVKVFIAMIAVALGGLIIWSCTQDEMENGQTTYRYSEDEITTLHAMAEKYGVPEVVFPTESSNKLLALKDMEDIFKTFGAIKYSLSMPLEHQDSTVTSITYKTKKPLVPSLRKKRASGGESSSYSFTELVSSYPATLTFKVSWNPNRDQNGNITSYSLFVSGSLELPMALVSRGYFYQNGTTSYSKNYDETLNLTYKCDLCHYDGYGQTIKEPISFTHKINAPAKPN